MSDNLDPYSKADHIIEVWDSEVTSMKKTFFWLGFFVGATTVFIAFCIWGSFLQ